MSEREEFGYTAACIGLLVVGLAILLQATHLEVRSILLKAVGIGCLYGFILCIKALIRGIVAQEEGSHDVS
jgi:hypothetical protein